MLDNHYTEKKSFSIYALTLPDVDNAGVEFCFIGKTSSRVSAAYSRHVCGKVSATHGFFDEPDSHPSLYLLETKPLTTAEAYQRCLAWIHIFNKNGYDSLNHYRSQFQSKKLFPKTAVIVDELSQQPLRSILAKSFVRCPADADRKQGNRPTAEPKPIQEQVKQMNIHLTVSDKLRFSDYCKSLHLKQREGFSLLLDYATKDSKTMHLDSLLTDLNQKISKLESENAALKKQLSASASDIKTSLDEYSAFIKSGIDEYLTLLFPKAKFESPTKLTPYRRFIRSKDVGIRYQYPTESGHMVLRFEAALWGSGAQRAMFIVGSDLQGNLYRLRYYPRKNYTGFVFNESPYATAGSLWHVGFQQAKDGAMNLLSAFPLPPSIEYHLQDNHCNKMFTTNSPISRPTLSLDKKIKEAKSKSEHK